jgi:TPR repeat protein
MYENGRGVEKDETEAVRWYRKVVDQGVVENSAEAVPAGPDNFSISPDVVRDGAEGVPAEFDSNSDADSGAVSWRRSFARVFDAKADPARKYVIGAVFVSLLVIAVCAFNAYVQAVFEQGESYYEVEDYPAAFEKFQEAAYLGHAAAQLKLGMMYEGGRGVDQDEEEAIRWYQHAADQGEADAQYTLGVKYYAGQGVMKDETEACKWFRKAADQGDVLAQYTLGMRYYAGQGVVKDDAEAYMWVILALSKTDPSSPDYSKQVEFRDLLDARLTVGQRAETQRLAQEWQKQHAR